MTQTIEINEDDALLIWKTIKKVFEWLPRDEQRELIRINTNLLSIIDKERLQ